MMIWIFKKSIFDILKINFRYEKDIKCSNCVTLTRWNNLWHQKGYDPGTYQDIAAKWLIALIYEWIYLLWLKEEKIGL